MGDDDHHKPVPAREAAGRARAKPTPVRDLTGEPPAASPEADVPEVTLEVDGDTWTVRVLGRSGGAAGTRPPLLLLGFWSGGGEGDPSLEALVVGTSLASLSGAALKRALSGAEAPRDPGRKKPFFEGAGQARRR